MRNDVPKMALRNMIITRFALRGPDHPLTQTRFEAHGGNPFKDIPYLRLC